MAANDRPKPDAVPPAEVALLATQSRPGRKPGAAVAGTHGAAHAGALERGVNMIRRNHMGIRPRVHKWWVQSRFEGKTIDEIRALEDSEGLKSYSHGRVGTLLRAYDMYTREIHPDHTHDSARMYLLTLMGDIYKKKRDLWESENPPLEDDPTKGDALKWSKESLSEHGRHQLNQTYNAQMLQVFSTLLRLDGLIGTRRETEEDDFSQLPAKQQEALFEVLNAGGGEVEIEVKSTKTVKVLPAPVREAEVMVDAEDAEVK